MLGALSFLGFRDTSVVVSLVGVALDSEAGLDIGLLVASVEDAKPADRPAKAGRVVLSAEVDVLEYGSEVPN